MNGNLDFSGPGPEEEMESIRRNFRQWWRLQLAHREDIARTKATVRPNPQAIITMKTNQTAEIQQTAAPAWTLNDSGTGAEIVETKTGLTVARLFKSTPKALALMLAAPEMAEALLWYIYACESAELKPRDNDAASVRFYNSRLNRARALLARINGGNP